MDKDGEASASVLRDLTSAARDGQLAALNCRNALMKLEREAATRDKKTLELIFAYVEPMIKDTASVVSACGSLPVAQQDLHHRPHNTSVELEETGTFLINRAVSIITAISTVNSLFFNLHDKQARRQVFHPAALVKEARAHAREAHVAFERVIVLSFVFATLLFRPTNNKFGITDVSTSMTNAFPRHPGQYIDEYLVARGSSVAEAAQMLGLSRGQLHRVISGDSDLSTDLALALERNGSERTARDWLLLQVDWDLAKAARAGRSTRNRDRRKARTITP